MRLIIAIWEAFQQICTKCVWKAPQVLFYWVLILISIQKRHAKYFIPFDITGPALPFNSLIDSAMAESPDGDGVLIFGGQNGDIPDKIIELRAGTNSWVTLNQTLKNPNFQHTVIPIHPWDKHIAKLPWRLILS